MLCLDHLLRDLQCKILLGKESLLELNNYTNSCVITGHDVLTVDFSRQEFGFIRRWLVYNLNNEICLNFTVIWLIFWSM